LGRRFTGPEREQIGKLISEGLTNREIAERLGRTEAAVRNIRYREGLRAATANQLPELTRQRDKLRGEVEQLTQRRTFLSAENGDIKTRTGQASKALQLNDETLRTRIQSELVQLKQQRPELFIMTGQEQLNRLTVELATTFLKWLTA
jgi:predicted transcriptional regulator